MSQTLYSSIKKSLTGKFSVYIFQFISLAFYARIFTPEEFGIIAVVQVFVVFFQLFSDLGLGPAIISKDIFTRSERDGVFTVTLIIGGGVSTVFYFFCAFLNDFYADFNYSQVSSLICLAIFFNTLNILPVTSLNKDTKFLSIAVVDVTVELITLVIVITISNFTTNIFALASRPALQASLRFFIMWSISSNTVIGRASFSRQVFHIKSLLNFSVYQFMFNFVNYFSRNIDNILVGKYIGFSELGVYEKSYQLMRYPLMLTTSSLAPAIQPVLSKHRSDVNYIVKKHNELIYKIMSTSLLISVYMYHNSFNIVFFLFGEQWLNVVPIIVLFCFMIPVQAVLSSSGAFFQVMNMPKYLFYSGITSSFVTVFSIIFTIQYGDIKIIALAVVLSTLCSFVITYTILFRKVFKTSAKSFVICVCKPFIIFSPVIIMYQAMCNLGGATLFDMHLFNLVFSFLIFLILLYFYSRLFYYCYKQECFNDVEIFSTLKKKRFEHES